MINSIYDLAYINDDGSYIMPSGPCMGWPLSRNQPGPRLLGRNAPENTEERDTQIKASPKQMAGSLLQSSVQAIQHGRASSEEREKRMDLCRACKHFIEKERRCSECGCFMAAKTWIKAATCPVGKW